MYRCVVRRSACPASSWIARAGAPRDKRADIWAFGVVLFEMVTGRRAFAGEDTSDVLAGVIKSEPDWSALPTLPPLLDSFLRQCLKKDPKQRLADMQNTCAWRSTAHSRG